VKGALWVCERDIRKFVRQPTIMISALVAPFLMLILIGSAFGGSIVHVPVAVVRDSQGSYSSALLDILGADDTVRLTAVPNLDTAEYLLRQGKVKAIICIPVGFDSTLANKNSVFLPAYLDNTDPLCAAAVSGAFGRASQRFLAQLRLVSSHDVNLTVDLANTYRKVEYIEFMASASIVQAIFMASMIGGGISILVDKQRGVIEGYLVTPLRRYEIVGGVLLAGVIKAMFSSIAMLFLAIVVAGLRPIVDATGFLLLLLTIFLTGLGLISMMTALAVRAPATEVYTVSAVPINLVLFFASGAIFPIEGFPDWMRGLATVNPETYAVHALRLLMYKGAGLSAVGGDLALLTVFTAIMCGIATMAFKRAL
jgi:ABC-2 type transport system permease protein